MSVTSLLLTFKLLLQVSVFVVDFKHIFFLECSFLLILCLTYGLSVDIIEIKSVIAFFMTCV